MAGGLADWLFDPSGLTAHGFCLSWEPGLIWTYALSDIGIGVAYFTIPVGLAIFARRRRDLVYGRILWLFAAFILLCGTTHWMDVLTLWVPAYGLEAAVKAATAVVSLATGVVLWRLMPQALSIPTAAQMREANDALRESEARYRMSFEQSPVPLHALDGNDVITGVSNSWLALMGYTRAEVVGRPIAELWAPGSGLTKEDDRAALLTNGEVHNLQRRLIRRDGSVVEALISARLEQRGTPMVVVCGVTDVTARARAEEALRASEERLRQAQKMEAVGQLTGGIAHDFNNMLQAIGGGLELIERRVGQGRIADLPRYFASTHQAIDNAASLTQRLMAFSRRQPLQPRAVEPDTLVRGMEELIRRTVGPAIRVEVRLHDGVWSAQSDPNQLESALLNLAINARDAMPDGGTLTIATADRRMSAADLAHGDEGEPGDYVELAVSDTGVGMEADVMARVFEPFFTTKPIGAGTGLGLSQLYGFVRQSGGFVRMESAPGKGTTVRLYLPRRDEPEGALPEVESAPAAARDEREATPISGATVLVVEDEQDVRALVVDALHEMGCVVLQAENGGAAMQVLHSGERVDLLVTDVGLPGQNGRQLAEAARADRPALPVILMTGYAGTALDRLPLAHDMELIRKPFGLDTFTDTVSAMLGRVPADR
jgi:PAS domain S-box-containing protein